MGPVLEMKPVRSAVLLAALLVASCGNDKEALRPKDTIVSAIQAFRNRNAPAEQVGLSRALLAQVETPVQLVTLEKPIRQALVAKVAQNNGVETWSTESNETISTKGGVLIATRGLGDDLMSATAIGGEPLRAGGSQYVRRYTHLNGLDQTVVRDFSCSTASNGSETIEIVEKSFPSIKTTERCTSGAMQFVNVYWWGGNGELLRSNQWISPVIGHILIEDLRK